MNTQSKITLAEPAILVRARKRLADLQRAAETNAFPDRAKFIAKELEAQIEWSVENEMVVLRGEYAHTSSLAFWLGDWGAAIDGETLRAVRVPIGGAA